MKSLRQIIFTSAMVIGLAFSVSAQKDDQKRPPKDPPKIDPGKKVPPRGNPPKGEDKPKKPGMSFYLAAVKKESDTV
jgi:hypothetical protein